LARVPIMSDQGQQPSALKRGRATGKLASVTHLARARAVFDCEVEALQAVRDQLDSAFDAAVDLAAETLRQRGKIVVVGIGKSGNIGRKVAATLTSTGSTSVVLNSVDALHGDLGIIHDGDLILALSYSGETEELLNLLPALKRFSVKIIAMTCGNRSTLARHSDLVLKVKIPREACPFNLAPTASTTAMLVMGDALAIAILQARGFRKQDYAKRHPSGAIGRALLLRVRDIMRKDDRNALAHEDLSVKQALLIMTQARSGSVSVIDDSGRLVGVFTDGDLRRRMATDGEVLSKPLRDLMTRQPIAIDQDALAMEALKVFDQRNIDDLIVVNGKQEPVGLIDSQDLPKMKLL
jgi:arabinose-5-phosphate isomerase